MPFKVLEQVGFRTGIDACNSKNGGLFVLLG
jgi:hypothetical protein